MLAVNSSGFAELPWPEAERQGQEFTISVKLQDIKRYVLPEVDQEFVESLDYDSVEEFREEIQERVEQEAAREAEAKTDEKIRDAVGDRMDIMVEFHSMWQLLPAMQIARALTPFGTFWHEDPIRMDSLASLRRYAEVSPAPIVWAWPLSDEPGVRAGLGGERPEDRQDDEDDDREEYDHRGRPVVVAAAAGDGEVEIALLHAGDGELPVLELPEDPAFRFTRETRPGDVFTLGANTWRVQDVTDDRLIVTDRVRIPRHELNVSFSPSGAAASARSWTCPCWRPPTAPTCSTCPWLTARSMGSPAGSRSETSLNCPASSANWPGWSGPGDGSACSTWPKPTLRSSTGSTSRSCHPTTAFRS